MNHRQRMLAVLRYEDYDRMPIIHFGFWQDTLRKWADEGHITHDEAEAWTDGNDADRSISAKLGFDSDYSGCQYSKVHLDLHPAFESYVVEEMEGGMRKIVNLDGVIVLQKDDVVSIPAEIDHILKTRKDWEEHYLPRLQFSEDRITLTDEDKAYLEDPDRSEWRGIYCGSLFGRIREWVGVEGTAYIYADDEELFVEMIDTVGDLCYRGVEALLKKTSAFDYAHFWEDICFKSGPLISPRVFNQYVAHHYKRITDLVNSYGIDIVSLDCDGKIDDLVPIWFHNGVNTMFPIEVGTWNASIEPWREEFGAGLRGVGGMNKIAFAHDRAAIDEEIERMKRLAALGGFVPCPDHRIAPDAKWDNVRYYCDRMLSEFS